MGTTIRFRLFLSCFALIAGIALVVDFSAPTSLNANRIDRIILELVLCFFGALVMTWIFSRSIEWRIQRLKVFAEHVLDTNNMNAPLPEEGEETVLLNQSLRRMASRIRELVDRLNPGAIPPRRHPQKHGGGRAGGGPPHAGAVWNSGAFQRPGPVKRP